MKSMKAGQFSSLVTVQQRASGQDPAGQPLITWEKVASVWANIRHRSGLEAIKADADTSIVKASIRIRYRDGINAGMRVLHGATIYDIKAVLPDVAKKEHLDLICEVVNG